MQFVQDIHYPICLDFKFQKLYLVWIEYDEDELLINDNRKIIAFKSEDELLHYWRSNIKEKYKEVVIYDIFKLQQWLLFPSLKFDNNEFLNMWNLFTDIAKSTKLEFRGDVKDLTRNLIYDKLFNGSGVFIADESKFVFSDNELTILVEVLQQGIELLLNNLIVADKETNPPLKDLLK